MIRKTLFLAFIVSLAGLTTGLPEITDVEVSPENPENGEEFEVVATAEQTGARIVRLEAKEIGEAQYTPKLCQNDCYQSFTNDDSPWTFTMDGDIETIQVRAFQGDLKDGPVHSFSVEAGSGDRVEIE